MLGGHFSDRRSLLCGFPRMRGYTTDKSNYDLTFPALVANGGRHRSSLLASGACAPAVPFDTATRQLVRWGDMAMAMRASLATAMLPQGQRGMTVVVPDDGTVPITSLDEAQCSKVLSLHGSEPAQQWVGLAQLVFRSLQTNLGAQEDITDHEFTCPAPVTLSGLRAPHLRQFSMGTMMRT